MSDYTVRQGDCLFSIAKDHGFSDWRTIYDHPNNAEFRRLRPDPNLIFPGDVLFIPEREKRTEDGSTDQKHPFKLHAQKAYLYLILEDDEGKPLAGTYTLEVEGVVLKQGTLENGEIKTEIAADAENGTLTVIPEDAPPEVVWIWPLRIGHLDPLDTVSGIQGRMWNLGFECGPVDNIEGPLTRGGVREFQRMAFPNEPKEWDGIAGSKTKGKFLEHHKV
jgi:N-acetylmuramoyl-L-alanine amidase